MTDKSFLTESVTGVDRCGKEIVSIDLPDGVLGSEFNLLAAHMFHAMSKAQSMSDLCKITGAKGKTIAALLDAEFPRLPDDGKPDLLISSRTMAYVQANILLTGPYATPSEELFKRASSFQQSLEAELKDHYKKADPGRAPQYRKELLTLLTTYYEVVFGMAGASGVTAPRALALCRTPKKPPQSADAPPADPADDPAAPTAGNAGGQGPAPAAAPPAGTAGGQGPAPAASPTGGKGGRGGKGGVARAGTGGK